MTRLRESLIFLNSCEDSASPMDTKGPLPFLVLRETRRSPSRVVERLDRFRSTRVIARSYLVEARL